MNAATKPAEEKSKQVMVHTDDLTFEEAHLFLSRLLFWSDVFDHHAEMAAGETPLDELVEGLEEKLFIQLTPDAAERFERLAMSLNDPVELWRVARRLDNHRIGLLRKVVHLFPEKEKQLKPFWFLFH